MSRLKGTPKTGGRQKGTANKATLEVRDLAKQYGPAAVVELARLAGLVKDTAGKPVGQSKSDQVRVAAIGMLLDRGYGKAPQPLVGDEDGAPVKQVLEVTWTVVDPVAGTTMPAQDYWDRQRADGAAG
jgi:hypothetical protein